VASKLLSGQGFKEVYNLEGGISDWNGLTAASPKEFHLKFLDKGARPEKMILLAYQMEDALRQFYVEAQKKSPDKELAAAFANLAAVEEQHKQDIIDICSRISIIAPREQDAPPRIMEGGLDTMSFFRQNDDFLKTSTGALSLAMMVETQSLDLYLRLAQEVTDKTAKQFLLNMGDREKEHLRTLAVLFVQKR
jgi:rubrerythrin